MSTTLDRGERSSANSLENTTKKQTFFLANQIRFEAATSPAPWTITENGNIVLQGDGYIYAGIYIFEYKFTVHNIQVHVHYYFVIIVIDVISSSFLVKVVNHSMHMRICKMLISYIKLGHNIMLLTTVVTLRQYLPKRKGNCGNYFFTFTGGFQLGFC